MPGYLKTQREMDIFFFRADLFLSAGFRFENALILLGIPCFTLSSNFLCSRHPLSKWIDPGIVAFLVAPRSGSSSLTAENVFYRCVQFVFGRMICHAIIAARAR